MNINTEERKAILDLSLRQILDSFPVVGPILNNIFFEFRTQVKQERLNKLVEVLESDLAKLNIDPKSLQTEENLDLFETIFKKVADTRSEQKRMGLKNILVKGIQHPGQIAFCELFAEHMLSFHPKELEILAAHQIFVIEGKGPLLKKHELKEEIDQHSIWRAALNNPSVIVNARLKPGFQPREAHIMSEEYAEADNMLEKYANELVPGKFGISEDELKFFLQNLLSKGLLRDDGVGAIGTKPMEIMSITTLGLKFLDFIKM